MSTTAVGSPPLSLAGKVAIVTGASSGIGEATARAFAAAGAKLVLNGRDAVRLKSVAESILRDGGQAVMYVGAVESEATHVALVQLAIQSFGALHIAFNNAGIFNLTPLTTIPESVIDAMLSTNIKGTVFALKHQLPAIGKYATQQDWGVIINNSSAVSTRVKTGNEGSAVYASTKAAIDALSRMGALEGAKYHVRVNAIQPGVTVSQGVLNMMDRAALDAFNDTVSLAPAASTEEIAAFVVFVTANDTGRFFNGSVLLQDGGYNVK